MDVMSVDCCPYHLNEGHVATLLAKREPESRDFGIP
jgi:hypothetical protein